MSTYIVAWANGEFEFLESSYVSPLSGKTRPLRLYGKESIQSVISEELMQFVPATSDNVHQGQFALDVKRKVLPIYETLFDIEYPLPKLDTLVVSCSSLMPSHVAQNSSRQVNSMQVSVCAFFLCMSLILDSGAMENWVGASTIMKNTMMLI